jgi:hypothetical protein
MAADPFEGADPFEVQLAVGSKQARRSCTWKFIVQKNDVYCISRMLRRHVKLSLHESGRCQWSGTSPWVEKDPTRKNSDRHFVMWQVPRESGRPVAQIVLLESELRCFEEVKPGRVYWIPPPPLGHAYNIVCFFSPPSTEEPPEPGEPYVRIRSMRLADGRWFVLELTQTDVPPVQLEEVRSAIASQVPAEVSIMRDLRAIVVQTSTEPPSLIEIVLT